MVCSDRKFWDAYKNNTGFKASARYLIDWWLNLLSIGLLSETFKTRWLATIKWNLSNASSGKNMTIQSQDLEHMTVTELENPKHYNHQPRNDLLLQCSRGHFKDNNSWSRNSSSVQYPEWIKQANLIEIQSSQDPDPQILSKHKIHEDPHRIIKCIHESHTLSNPNNIKIQTITCRSMSWQNSKCQALCHHHDHQWHPHHIPTKEHKIKSQDWSSPSCPSIPRTTKMNIS